MPSAVQWDLCVALKHSYYHDYALLLLHALKRFEPDWYFTTAIDFWVGHNNAEINIKISPKKILQYLVVYIHADMEILSALLAFCGWNPLVFSHKRSVMRRWNEKIRNFLCQHRPVAFVERVGLLRVAQVLLARGQIWKICMKKKVMFHFSSLVNCLIKTRRRTRNNE